MSWLSERLQACQEGLCFMELEFSVHKIDADVCKSSKISSFGVSYNWIAGYEMGWSIIFFMSEIPSRFKMQSYLLQD
jgi:hypothetical protein